MSILVSLVIVSQFHLKSGLSLDEKSSLYPLDQDLNAQIWKRFPCIVGTRYRTRRCRRSQGKRGLGRTKNLRYSNVLKHPVTSCMIKSFRKLSVIAPPIRWPCWKINQDYLGVSKLQYQKCFKPTMEVLENTKKWGKCRNTGSNCHRFKPFCASVKASKMQVRKNWLLTRKYFDSRVYFSCMYAQGQENGGLGSRTIDKNFFFFQINGCVEQGIADELN